MPYVAPLATSSRCCAAVRFCRPSLRTGTDESILVVCVASDKLGYFFSATGCGWLAGLLGGHTLAVSVCLMQLAPEIRESRAAERQSFCTHSNGQIDCATICDATSPPTYSARKYGINHRTLYTQIFTPNSQKLAV